MANGRDAKGEGVRREKEGGSVERGLGRVEEMQTEKEGRSRDGKRGGG